MSKPLSRLTNTPTHLALPAGGPPCGGTNVPDIMVIPAGKPMPNVSNIVDHLGSPRFIINTSAGTTELELDDSEDSDIDENGIPDCQDLL